MQLAWNKVTATQTVTPDEGVMLKVLDVAARWGEPDLALNVLSVLAETAEAQEHHMTALLEAYVSAGRVPEAIKVIATMRENGLSPTISTIEPIAAVLSTPEIIDQALYGIEDIHAAKEPVDIAAVNAVILASSRLGDLRRARATQAMIGQIGLIPNVDTFNLVLQGCIKASHRPLGDNIMAEMEAAGVKPDQTTYESMVELCLVPDEYEDAFFFLEKMKEEGYKPSLSVYQALLRKCATAQDKRWRLVQDEMFALGYKIDAATRRAISGSTEDRRSFRGSRYD